MRTLTVGVLARSRSPRRYTTAVDMWSLGCILGEILGAQPMFPGKSTMNQLEKIIEVTGRPTKSDIASVNSKFTQTMLDTLSTGSRPGPQKCGRVPCVAQHLNRLFPGRSGSCIRLLRLTRLT